MKQRKKTAFQTLQLFFMHGLPVTLLVFSGNVKADLSCVSAVNPPPGTFGTTPEQAAAYANQQTYNQLIESGCNDDQVESSANCSGNDFQIFKNVRALVHTGNEITGSGSTRFSLGLDLSGLKEALRWTAGEEMSAQSNLSSDYATAQLSGLSSRLTALRLGSSGFSLTAYDNQTNPDNDYAMAHQGRHLGGGASADSADLFSQWGGFLNVSYGDGDRSATVQEDAFDYEGIQVQAGIDYRLDEHWVVGSIVGYTDQDIDFDASKSVVEGGMETDGFSLLPFVLYQSDPIYWSISIGYQKVDIDTSRRVRYATENENGIDTLTKSSTDAETYSVYGSFGYSIEYKGFVFEPGIEADYLDITIDGFSENDVNDTSFNLHVNEQTLKSKTVSLGLNTQYTLTPEYGVFIPNIKVQWVNQFEDDRRTISSQYAQTEYSGAFEIITDKLDDQYYVISAGLYSVLRGGSQTSADSKSSGGLQAYFNFQFVDGLDDYSQKVFAAGVRYEF